MHQDNWASWLISAAGTHARAAANLSRCIAWQAFHDVVFDGGAGLRGGGLLSVENLHVRVQGCWFLRFGTVGLFVLNGHELYVDDTWASQATFAGLGTCGGNGTGMELRQADASVSNSVIFCTKLGVHLDGGNVVLENLHVYNTGQCV